MVVYQYRIGQYVKVVRIVDDLKCQHVGRTGVIIDTAVGHELDEAMYAIKFEDGTAHRFYESELETEKR